MSQQEFGRLPDGQVVTRHTLTGTGRLQVMDLGGTALSYRMVADEPRTEVLVGFDDFEWAVRGVEGYFGPLVGRYANRIAAARISVDGQEHRLAANEGPNQLHGGPEGFSHRIWQTVSADDQHVEFTLTSPDGDQGFPGTVRASARYELMEDGFALEMWATTDAPTPVCLTSHLFVNLAGGGTIQEHELTVPASKYLPIGRDSLPVSAPVPVAETPFDLRQGARIGERVRLADEQIGLASGIDHSFDIDGEGLRTHARLYDPASGRRMELRATAPALQVYTGNFMDGSMLCRNGRLRQGDAIAMEPDVHPDSPNQPWADDVILRPGQEYRTRMEWHFSA